MERHTNGKQVWLKFTLFAEHPKLIHGVFLRHGGVSAAPFDSLNFGLTQGDLEGNVAANRRSALQTLGLLRFTELWQHHGKTIVVAHPNHKAEGDGLTTCKKDLGLLILHADCQAAIFYDPIRHALSNVHCGWQGSVQNIYRETIVTMGQLYGSKPENLLVGVSPSLGPDASEFIHYKKELPQSFHPFQVKPCYFNFWDIARWQLKECGILDHHIEIAEICTFLHPEDYFSYRRFKGCGRHATIAALT